MAVAHARRAEVAHFWLAVESLRGCKVVKEQERPSAQSAVRPRREVVM